MPIDLRRRRPDEAIEAFRFDRTGRFDQLARQAARWVADNADRVRGADPDIPPGVFNRAADNWRPLLAIADVAGDEWAARTRRAAWDDPHRQPNAERLSTGTIRGCLYALFARGGDLNCHNATTSMAQAFPVHGNRHTRSHVAA